jgi:hypothetical protein
MVGIPASSGIPYSWTDPKSLNFVPTSDLIRKSWGEIGKWAIPFFIYTAQAKPLWEIFCRPSVKMKRATYACDEKIY